jgi:hypothetical protein
MVSFSFLSLPPATSLHTHLSSGLITRKKNPERVCGEIGGRERERKRKAH